MMSATDKDLVASVQRRMAARSITQRELASACGISQPHLSKILSRSVRLGRKAQGRLTDWMLRDDAGQTGGTDDELRRLLDRLLAGPEERRMQIMQLLEIVERLTRGTTPT